MDALILIVGLWFVIIGVYGAFVLPNGSKQTPRAGREATSIFHDAFASSQRAREKRTTTVPVTRERQEGSFLSGIFRPGEAQHRDRSLTERGVVREVRSRDEAPSEVERLRAEVEELRTELAALSAAGTASRPERPRLRRHGLGLYTYLPPTLRRQVREIRSTRRGPSHLS